MGEEEEEEKSFYFENVDLDETEQELIDVFLEQGESRAWIAKKIFVKDYIKAKKRQKVDRERKRLEAIQRKKDEEKRIMDEKRAAHKGSYFLGDTVLADYYGIGTYFKAVVQQIRPTTGEYALLYPDSGGRQDLPSPRIRKWREGFTEGDRLDGEDGDWFEEMKFHLDQDQKK